MNRSTIETSSMASSTYRRTWAIGVGVALLILVAVLAVFLWWGGSRAVAAEDYAYKIKQNHRFDVNYSDSSFFGAKPGPDNTAYVTDLTESIRAVFTYNFEAEQPADLQHSYNVTATVRSKYSLKSGEESSSNVWTKQFQLINESKAWSNTKQLTAQPVVEIPLPEYRQLVEEFRTALALPTGGEVVVTFTSQVTGDIDGHKLRDSKVSTMTVPLDQQIYQPVLKYDKLAEQTLLDEAATESSLLDKRMALIILIGLAAGGSWLVYHGLQRRPVRNSYQRELDKIYRYHDGIIIRASQPANLSSRTVVPVVTFDDLLNLSEETQSPIVSAPAGPTATKFIIIQADVAYVFTIGREVSDEIDDLIDPKSIHRTTRPHARKKS
ncbi:hypothetical protein B7Y94_02215 [Candidatus Saccharibacteria bacterium 32-49-12]|nr:MAG: hypothetical protein B7Y94_02215 [Candidatus Saccharibacteria bacterium 32-49-12]